MMMEIWYNLCDTLRHESSKLHNTQLIVAMFDIFLNTCVYTIGIGKGGNDLAEDEIYSYSFDNSLFDLMVLLFLRSSFHVVHFRSSAVTANIMWKGLILFCFIFSIAKAAAFDYSCWEYPEYAGAIIGLNVAFPIVIIGLNVFYKRDVQVAERIPLSQEYRKSRQIEKLKQRPASFHGQPSSEEIDEAFFTPTEGSTQEYDSLRFHQALSEIDVAPPEPVSECEKHLLANCAYLVENWKQIMDQAKEAFSDDKLFAACGILHSLQYGMEIHREELIRDHDQERVAIVQSLSSPLSRMIFSEESSARRLLRSFEMYDGWNLDSDDDNVRCWSQKGTRNILKTFKNEGIIEASLDTVFAVCFETELLHTWLKPMKGSEVKFAKELGALSRISKVVSLEIDCPWPFNKRSISLIGKGVDIILETGSIILTFKSVDKYPGVYIPPPSEGAVVLECQFIG
eukprot:TRINITY_DN6549_c0_g2_i3.p1 TRINITY_DN6549_c0_g2~~TRINITY_DN6549_c0_g2_i3.p1  ORF type:complete len:455 (-),score=70.44 TRINITY_DN6549_c0_g2_i3:945-2309(-)